MLKPVSHRAGYLIGPLCALITLSYAAGENPATKNLIRNGNFTELNNDGQPNNWQPNTWSGTAKFEVDKRVGRSSVPALKISSASGADASWSFQAVVKPHTDYRLTAWVKTDSLERATGLGALANLHQLQLQGKTDAVTGTQDWVQVSSTFNSGRHDQLLVNMLFGGWGRSRGTAWFDDVELVQIGTDLPTMSADEAKSFYQDKVRTVLQANCLKCHGDDPEKVRGGLRLTSLDAMREGGDSGPAVDFDSLGESLILEAINYESYEMPPDGQLSEEDIGTLTTWVKLGLPGLPDVDPDAVAPHGGTMAPEVNEQTKSWWSYQPIVRPEPPDIADPQWSQNPIDQFIADRLQQNAIDLPKRASRNVLVRRAFYDLTGLPPTPEQVDEFLSDTSPDAWEKLIDRLLASRQYGERWARHWLDIVRYAESNSFERDGTKPHVWRYRDYVIRSLNDDKPYDEFVIEQLAGDELRDPSEEAIIATAYYRLGQWDDEPADPLQARFDELDDILGTTTQAMLGMTMNCARCHDHKIDPIPQQDYYQMLAFFANVRRYGIRAQQTVEERSIRVMGRPLTKQRLNQHQDQLKRTEAGLKKIEQKFQADFIPVEFEEFKYPQHRIPLAEKRVGTLISRGEFRRYVELTEDHRRLVDHPPEGSRKILCVKERGPDAPESFVLIRGNPHVRGVEVEPGFPSVLSPPSPQVTAPANGESTGRRLALARWIVSEQNPLTARVMANRMWQYHFGRGIVRTPNDFGFQGTAPTHPRLLDWLASEFIDEGWSLKQMHRLMMSSRIYQSTSRFNPQAYAADPANDLFWRFDMRRLSAEEIRDSILAVNGTLNREKMYGPSVFPKLPAEVLAGQSRPGDGWGNSSPEDQARRSIYIHIKRSLKVPILESFDAADTDFSCPVRFVTTQPTQALGMLNSQFVQQQAHELGASARRNEPHTRGQIAWILRRVTQREPSSEEIKRGERLVEDLLHQGSIELDAALDRFCLVALNMNEFVYLD